MNRRESEGERDVEVEEISKTDLKVRVLTPKWLGSSPNPMEEMRQERPASSKFTSEGPVRKKLRHKKIQN